MFQSTTVYHVRWCHASISRPCIASTRGALCTPLTALEGMADIIPVEVVSGVPGQARRAGDVVPPQRHAARVLAGRCLPAAGRRPAGFLSRTWRCAILW